MRLSIEQINTIVNTSRAVSLLLRARIKTLLEQKLSLPVDVLVKNPGAQENPFVSIARAQAKLLETTP